MNDTPTSKPSREQRLALKLRENLRRRKAQARAQLGDRDQGNRNRGETPDDFRNAKPNLEQS